MRRAVLAFAAALTVGAAILTHPARAQDDDLAAGSGYGSENLTFERWCTEIQKYPPERCAARSAEDQASFKETLQALQAVEVQDALSKRRKQEFDDRMEAHRNLTPLSEMPDRF